jgi:hypothetical protein
MEEKLQAFKANPDDFDLFDSFEINCMLEDLTLPSLRYSKTGQRIMERGYRSGDNFGLIYHEYGHLMHYNNMTQQQLDRFKTQFSAADKAIAMKVSDYASTDFREFVAETYKALLIGHTFPQDVMDLYRKYNGPEVPQRARLALAA